MNRIEHEIKLLQQMAEDGKLPGYSGTEKDESFFAENSNETVLAEFDSRENDVLERQLKVLWNNDPEMLSCIPIILAAVEKSRGQAEQRVVHTELYNYTM